MCNSHGETGCIIELNSFFIIESEQDWKMIEWLKLPSSQVKAHSCLPQEHVKSTIKPSFQIQTLCNLKTNLLIFMLYIFFICECGLNRQITPQ